MLSYREKQLLMVQKYLLDRTQSSYFKIEKLMLQSGPAPKSEYHCPEYPNFNNFNDLASFVSKLDGYNTYIRVENILSKEEIEQLNKEYKQINEQFGKITNLTKVDLGFLFVAVALQVMRQIFQPKIDPDSEVFDKAKRDNDKQAEKDAKQDPDYKDKMDKQSEKAEQDETTGSRYYYAPLSEISDIKKGVPYDSIKGTKKFELEMSGNSHRLKTLGHDPVLGYLFGTCNILTNTMTLGAENLFETYHVKDSTVYAKGDSLKMLEYSYRRFQQSKATVGAAMVKQFYHIKSDELSKRGLALPFLQLFSDSERISDLTDSMDWAQLKYVLKITGKQLGYAALINGIIGLTHKLYMFLDEYKTEHPVDLQYSEFISDSVVKNIRTRKILLFSNTIATTSNLIVCGVSAAAGGITGNEKLVKFGVKNLDVGGLILTISHLFSDIRFITKVKKEFIQNVIQSNFENKLETIENPSELAELMDEFDRIVYKKQNYNYR